jgi:hypothetical protein
MDKLQHRFEQIDSDIVENEIKFLFTDCYLRIKRLLANDYVREPEMPERKAEIAKELKELKASYDSIK